MNTRNTPKHPGAMTPAEQHRKRTKKAVEILQMLFVLTLIFLFTLTIIIMN